MPAAINRRTSLKDPDKQVTAAHLSVNDALKTLAESNVQTWRQSLTPKPTPQLLNLLELLKNLKLNHEETMPIIKILEEKVVHKNDFSNASDLNAVYAVLHAACSIASKALADGMSKRSDEISNAHDALTNALSTSSLNKIDQKYFELLKLDKDVLLNLPQQEQRDKIYAAYTKAHNENYDAYTDQHKQLWGGYKNACDEALASHNSQSSSNQAAAAGPDDNKSATAAARTPFDMTPKPPGEQQ